MKPKTPEELIRYAGVEIMGWTTGAHCPTSLFDQNNKFVGVDTKDWRPTEDANQLEMIEAELVKLGFSFTDEKETGYWSVFILHHKPYIKVSNQCKDNKDYRLTRLTAFCEAYERFKELSK